MKSFRRKIADLHIQISSLIKWFVLAVAKAAWRIVTVPAMVWEAIFYVYKIDSHGNVVSSKFSIIKMFFSFSCFIMLFKLGVGASTLEDVRIWPMSSVSVKEKTVDSFKKSKKKRRLVKIKKTSPASKSNPLFTQYYIYVKKYIGTPTTTTDVLFFLVLAMLFYFRDEFNEGDKRGVFSQVVDALIAARVSSFSNSPPTQVVSFTRDTDSLIETPSATDDTVIGDMDKTGPRRNKKKKKSIKEDPFM